MGHFNILLTQEEIDNIIANTDCESLKTKLNNFNSVKPKFFNVKSLNEIWFAESKKDLEKFLLNDNQISAGEKIKITEIQKEKYIDYLCKTFFESSLDFKTPIMLMYEFEYKDACKLIEGK